MKAFAETLISLKLRMNPNIEKLVQIANRPVRLIIGLMSGTSLDGLDIALCRFEGHGENTNATILQFETVPYNEEFKEEIRTVFSRQQISLEQLCLLNPWIAKQHALMVTACLKKWDLTAIDIDLLASHGQTIYHTPKRLHGKEKFGNATLQIGDGDHLAVATGIITISDFRQKHIAAGGEGAPLAAYGDHLLFSQKGDDRILLNIGGIANFTWLPASGDQKEMISTDTGPGNTLMDAFIRKQQSGSSYDTNGGLASSGKINADLLNALKDHPFFRYTLPKTTGPELFNLEYLEMAMQKTNTTSLPVEDIMATLNRFTAETISEAIMMITGDRKNVNIYLSGGGTHNTALVDHLTGLLPVSKIDSLNKLGIDPDAKEALLFATLANECICGERNLIENEVAGMPGVSMGKISFPF